MKARKRNYFAVIGVFLFASMAASATQKPSKPETELVARVMFDPQTQSHYVTLANKSSSLLCISEFVFDTARTFIGLKDFDGKIQKMLIYKDGKPEYLRGVDLSPAYYLLQPNASRMFSIDDRNFAVERHSRYRYELSFPYYRCADLMGLEHKPENYNLSKRWVHASGEFDWKTN